MQVRQSRPAKKHTKGSPKEKSKEKSERKLRAGGPAMRKNSFVLLPERFARCALPLRHPPSAGFSKVPSADSLRI